MAHEEVFNAVRDSCTLIGGFVTEVAQEVGMERATEMYGRVFEGFGEMIANVVEEHRGDAEAAGKVAAELEQLNDSFGMEPGMEISPTTLLVHSRSCPFYDMGPPRQVQYVDTFPSIDDGWMDDLCTELRGDDD